MMTYDVEYKEGKAIKEGVLTIDLDAYVDSYNTNQFHLGQSYPEYIVNQYTHENKVEFLESEVKKQFGAKAKMYKSDIKSLITEIDDDVNEAYDEGLFF